ncbi:MAG: hypothetical protein WCK75_03730 [Elusimicrobiota bacterium]
MKHKEREKPVTTGKQDHIVEDALENFRDELKKKATGSEIGNEVPESSPTVEREDLQFQASPGLVALLKFLVKVSPPPKPRAVIPVDADTPSSEPENEPETGPDLPESGAIHPSSSAWIIWLTIIGLAIFYLIDSGVLNK